VYACELLTGRSFVNDNCIDTMNAILHEEPRLPPASKFELPPDIHRILRKALEKIPTDRHQTVAELAADLGR
jgi:serine/threonine protein kinase